MKYKLQKETVSCELTITYSRTLHCQNKNCWSRILFIFLKLVNSGPKVCVYRESVSCCQIYPVCGELRCINNLSPPPAEVMSLDWSDWSLIWGVRGVMEWCMGGERSSVHCLQCNAGVLRPPGQKIDCNWQTPGYN